MRCVKFWGLGGVLLTLLLTGCGDDRPVYDQPGPPQAAASPPADSPLAAAPSQSGAPDPLAPSADPLTSGGDPLTKGTDGMSASSSDDLSSGQKMPTQHSHWLTGYMRDASVTVRLNGMRLGEYSNVIDKDITMKLRAGINSVTFDYTPQSTTAFARLNLLESEHDPPIAPLATFRSPQISAAAVAQPISQTDTFVAH